MTPVHPLITSGLRVGCHLRDDRYGSLWELVGAEDGRARGYGFAWVEVDPGALSPLHWHERTEELYVVTAGSGVVTLDDRRLPVAPGDTIVIPPGVRHAIEAGAGGLGFLCLTAPPYDPEDDYEVEP